MMTIKAPFNFVPVSSKVYCPEWADLISHDVPFEDAVSGTIKVKITAKTPIFVRNGHAANDTSAAAVEFSKYDDKYFIPGTSIKGAIRNVLEIMSYGKMTTQETHKYALKWRDGGYPRPNTFSATIKTGWLQKGENGYYVEECPYARIGHADLDRGLGLRQGASFTDSFSRNGAKSRSFSTTQTDPKTGKETGPKTAHYKYELVKGRPLELSFSRVGVNERTRIEVLKIDPNGTRAGTIVLTGQPNQWRESEPQRRHDTRDSGKFYEFVFLNGGNRAQHPVSDAVYDEFAFLNQNNYQWSEVWKKPLERDGKKVPVFFRVRNDGKVESLGLSYLYKLPGGVSPSECLPQAHKDACNEGRHDLAECIFGYASPDDSLKGRVQFGHAFCAPDCSPTAATREYVLANPRASYYPIYALNGAQWQAGTTIAGWKRYVVRQQEYCNSEGNDAMKSKANVLNAGAEFVESIAFHNLKRVEIGALLAALTFDGHQGCLHSIGQGKPFGWGAVSIAIESLACEGGAPADWHEYVRAFEQAMTKAIPGWEAGLSKLYELASPIPAAKNEEYSYMSLDSKDFATAKQNHECLTGTPAPHATTNRAGYAGDHGHGNGQTHGQGQGANHHHGGNRRQDNQRGNYGHNQPAPQKQQTFPFELEAPLGGKSKKDKWLVKVMLNQKDTLIAIDNTGEVPPDKQLGDTVKVKVINQYMAKYLPS